MSQSLTRKAPAKGEGRPRARVPSKASGDAAKSQQPEQNHQHHRSKSKIPKSVRYDLENALVGLCDVWFEDIKPHLLRNNIKVHVHVSGAGEEPASESDAGAGDQRARLSLTSGVLGCSHQDPAATAARCELCRLLFNAANSIESAVSQAASASLQAHAPTVVTPESSNTTTDHGAMSSTLEYHQPARHGARPPRPVHTHHKLKPDVCRTSSLPTPFNQPVHILSFTSNLNQNTREMSTQTEWPRRYKKKRRQGVSKSPPRKWQSSPTSCKHQTSPESSLRRPMTPRSSYKQEVSPSLSRSRAQTPPSRRQPGVRVHKRQSASTVPTASYFLPNDRVPPPSIVPPLFDDDLIDLLNDAQDHLDKTYKRSKRKRYRHLKLTRTSQKNVVVKKKPPWR